MDLSVIYNNLFEPIKDFSFFGIELIQIIIFLFYFLFFSITFFVLKNIILARLEEYVKKTTNNLDDSIITFVRKIKYIFYLFFSLYISSKLVNIGESPTKIIKVLFTIILVYEIILLAQNIGYYFLAKMWKGEDENSEQNETAIEGLSIIMKLLLWGIGGLIILTNLGVEINALVASLGVSSIAVAFALQSILSDIFSSFSIYFDKPFHVNDFIIVDNDMGVVKKIGIKTTRIETLQGEELIVSNHELTSTRIHNYKRMEKRRIVFTIGVVYGTPASQLRKIPEYIHEIITAQDTAEFDRSHFATYGDFSLNFETVYYVTSGDYIIYMDTQQSINLGIYEKFENEGIEFAYPTQTLFVEKNGN